MGKAKRCLLAALVALGLMQLGSPLAYLTIGSKWYGCYAPQFFEKVKYLLYVPLVDELLALFIRPRGDSG